MRSVRVGSVLVAIAFTVLVGILLGKGRGGPAPVQAAASIGVDDMGATARTKVFFGHQSVGMNVLDGVAGLYAERGLPAPEIVLLAPTVNEPEWPGGADAYIAHAYIGRNGDPLSKIADFDARVRGGVGDEVDVAFMKLCYTDVTSDTDVEEVFRRYRETMTALERDYPDVTFLHVTAPLTTEQDLASKAKSTLKALLGRGADDYGAADNEARERLNALMRAEYGSGRLFDLAAVESTAPDGDRVSGSHEGRRYSALYDGYAADPGHLNPAGATTAAASLVRVISATSPE